MIMKEWNKLENSISQFYRGIDLEIRKDEIDYLREAYFFTEELWLKEFHQMDSLKYIMLSEAPLFRDSQNYFYNQETAFSSFFYFKDIEAFGATYSQEQYNSKTYVLDVLKENGFIILDLFPFALNSEDTQINYNSLKKKEYAKLLDIVIKDYISTKLDLIKTKCRSETQLFYRYKRLKQKLNGKVEHELSRINLIEKGQDLETLNNNMSLDRKKLKQIIQAQTQIS